MVAEAEIIAAAGQGQVFNMSRQTISHTCVDRINAAIGFFDNDIVWTVYIICIVAIAAAHDICTDSAV